MDSVLLTIADPNSTQSALLESIRNIGSANEPSQFWTDIANNPRFSPDTRRRAVFLLFKRHIKPGMSIRDVGEILGRPAWLKQSDISLVNAIGGEIPVQFSPDDAVIALKVFPGSPEGRFPYWAVYLKIEGKISPEELYKIFYEKETPYGDLGNRKLIEFGLTPNDPENIHV